MLLDAHAMSIEYPQSFILPSAEQLGSIVPGSFLKISSNGERFWVVVQTVDGNNINASIDNNLRHPLNVWKRGDSILLHTPSTRATLMCSCPEAAQAFVTALAHTPAAGSERDVVLSIEDASASRPQTGEELFLLYVSHILGL